MKGIKNLDDINNCIASGKAVIVTTEEIIGLHGEDHELAGIDGKIVLVGTTVACAGVLPPLIPAEERFVRTGILYQPEHYSPE